MKFCSKPVFCHSQVDYNQVIELLLACLLYTSSIVRFAAGALFRAHVQRTANDLSLIHISGTIYHQFCPADRSENGFFAISTHTNEAWGLTGELLEIVLANKGNIALLTEPAPQAALHLLEDAKALEKAIYVDLDLD